MDASPLNTVPGELRNRIYELVLVKPTSIVFDFGALEDEKFALLDPNALALTLTCKQIYNESKNVFSSRNHFVLDLDGLDSMHQWPYLEGRLPRVTERLLGWFNCLNHLEDLRFSTVEVAIEILGGGLHYQTMRHPAVLIAAILATLKRLGQQKLLQAPFSDFGADIRDVGAAVTLSIDFIYRHSELFGVHYRYHVHLDLSLHNIKSARLAAHVTFSESTTAMRQSNADGTVSRGLVEEWEEQDPLRRLTIDSLLERIGGALYGLAIEPGYNIPMEQDSLVVTLKMPRGWTGGK